MTTGVAIQAASQPLTKHDAQKAKLERDLSAWLAGALREQVVSSQGIPVEMPKWFQDQIARGVRVRVTVESL